MKKYMIQRKFIKPKIENDEGITGKSVLKKSVSKVSEDKNIESRSASLDSFDSNTRD